jgi:integrase
VHSVLRPELEAAFKSAPRDVRGNLLEPYVFPSPEGGMRNEAWHTAKLVRRIAGWAGVMLPQGFTFHDLRKTFLTHLVHDTGGNIAAGQKLAGHSTPAILTTYYLGQEVGFLVEAMDELKLVEAPSAGEHTARTPRLHVVSHAGGRSRK